MPSPFRTNGAFLARVNVEFDGYELAGVKVPLESVFPQRAGENISPRGCDTAGLNEEPGGIVTADVEDAHDSATRMSRIIGSPFWDRAFQASPIALHLAPDAVLTRRRAGLLQAAPFAVAQPHNIFR